MYKKNFVHGNETTRKEIHMPRITSHTYSTPKSTKKKVGPLLTVLKAGYPIGNLKLEGDTITVYSYKQGVTLGKGGKEIYWDEPPRGRGRHDITRLTRTSEEGEKAYIVMPRCSISEAKLVPIVRFLIENDVDTIDYEYLLHAIEMHSRKAKRDTLKCA